ncbi:MAG: hypothetical protein AAF203_01345 [Pseudomonadota bacterium]
MEWFRDLVRPQKKLSDISLPASVGDLFSEFDIFYVCYSEPNREENWAQILSILPKAQKVEGVHGFDRALKVCARKSKTNHFFVIDGDNQIVEERIKRQVPVSELKDHWVLSWSSLNPVNGLNYGNGGLKLWPKSTALKIKSHEKSSKDQDQTDYCFLADYYLIDDFATKTIMNKTPEQAFRAGFREGVKMSLAWGKQVPLSHDNFELLLGPQNRMRLKTWCEAGADCKNGLWGIAGARLGLKKNVVDLFDCQEINSYEKIDHFMEKELLNPLKMTKAREVLTQADKLALMTKIQEWGDEIRRVIPLNLTLMSPEESQRFKNNFVNPERSGLLKERR